VIITGFKDLLNLCNVYVMLVSKKYNLIKKSGCEWNANAKGISREEDYKRGTEWLQLILIFKIFRVENGRMQVKHFIVDYLFKKHLFLVKLMMIRIGRTANCYVYIGKSIQFQKIQREFRKKYQLKCFHSNTTTYLKM